MPLFWLVLLGLGGYVWYRKQQQVPPPMFQGQTNLPGLGQGNVTVQQLPPVAQPLAVKLTSDVAATVARDSDGRGIAPADALSNLANHQSTRVFKAGTVVTLVPDPAYIGTAAILFHDMQSAADWAAFAFEFHWVPA